MKSHLRFIKLELGGRKTFVWHVESAYDGSLLGDIKWYAPWRQYVLMPFDGCVWSHDCLSEVSEFIKLHKKDRSIPSDKLQSVLIGSKGDVQK